VECCAFRDYIEHIRMDGLSVKRITFYLQIPDKELWDAPFSFGLHTCVKPTAKYKGQMNSESVFLFCLSLFLRLQVFLHLPMTDSFFQYFSFFVFN